MGPFTMAKLALALIAAVLLGWGIRNDDSALRWAGMAFLFVAVLFRFFQPKGKP
ncbi:MAG: hypothetical protein M3365_06275 [Gemmatimonadota bacterium]|nr:hypothetical protein [Gemmatimonadota bacterium]